MNRLKPILCFRHSNPFVTVLPTAMDAFEMKCALGVSLDLEHVICVELTWTISKLSQAREM